MVINATKQVMSIEKIRRYLKGNKGEVANNLGADQWFCEAQQDKPTVQVIELKRYDSSEFREELLESLL